MFPEQGWGEWITRSNAYRWLYADYAQPTQKDRYYANNPDIADGFQNDSGRAED